MPIYRLFSQPQCSRVECCDLPYPKGENLVIDVTGYNYNTTIYRGKDSINRNSGANTNMPLRWFKQAGCRHFEVVPGQTSFDYANMHYRFVFRLPECESKESIRFILETPDDVMPTVRDAQSGHTFWVKAIPSGPRHYLWNIKW